MLSQVNFRDDGYGYDTDAAVAWEYQYGSNGSDVFKGVAATSDAVFAAGYTYGLSKDFTALSFNMSNFVSIFLSRL